jgi:hypothetical protein
VLAGVLTLVQISAGKGMGVIPAEAGRARRKRVARVATFGDKRSPLFHGAVHLRRQSQAMPVDHFAIARLVANIDGDRTAFWQTKQWARYLAVVGECLDGPARSNVKFVRGDVDGVVSGGSLLSKAAQRCGSDGHARQPEHLSPRNQTSS